MSAPTWTPHYAALGDLAGGRLDELARIADRHGPVLHARDKFGRDEDWIEYHPAYREMEKIAFEQYQFHAMSHRAGVLGMDRPLPPVAKYAFTYLFVQGEFGLMCPISVTDTSIHLIGKFASPELRDYLLPKMLSADPATFWKGTQFMTEKAGGSDVGAIETVARNEGGTWRLYGDKWFCSHTDADVALLLARPEGAPAGTRGLALFALPRRLKDGSRNAYRIVRLKDKMGTRSMASGEIRLEGAEAYLVGDVTAGLKQMMEQVNLSRLSHGVRAAAMMRRCVNESLTVGAQPHRLRPADHRVPPAAPATGKDDRADGAGAVDGDGGRRRDGPGQGRRRGSRGGTAHPDPAAEAARLPRQHRRRHRRDGGPRRQRLHRGLGEPAAGARRPCRPAVGGHQQHQRAGCHPARRRQGGRRIAPCRRCCAAAWAMPRRCRRISATSWNRRWTAPCSWPSRWQKPAPEPQARRAATALYDAASAVLLAWEGSRPGADARRVLLARMVIAHRLSPQDPLEIEDAAGEDAAIDLLLDETPLTLDRVAPLLAG